MAPKTERKYVPADCVAARRRSTVVSPTSGKPRPRSAEISVPGRDLIGVTSDAITGPPEALSDAGDYLGRRHSCSSADTLLARRRISQSRFRRPSMAGLNPVLPVFHFGLGDRSSSDSAVYRRSSIAASRTVSSILSGLPVSIGVTREVDADTQYGLYRLTISMFGKTGFGEWTISRRYSEIFEFKEDIVAALQPSHRCSGSCPVLYFHMKYRFPRKHVVRGSKNSAVVQERVKSLQDFFSGLLIVLANDQFRRCQLGRSHVLTKISEFLTENGESADSYHLAERLILEAENGSLEDTDTQSLSSYSEAICGLCEKAIDCSKTILDCGHSFHDECILNFLQSGDAAACPRCHFALNVS